jgi:hypothetical protein
VAVIFGSEPHKVEHLPKVGGRQARHASEDTSNDVYPQHDAVANIDKSVAAVAAGKGSRLPTTGKG